ncbi:uncharacterized protein BKA78DRAFT_306952 [Phyllosticta capitalensis]|uniref:uncharacterized protein n=1 Tax=Phyllosticta capitalensis TaxID=121624 RepID=UPI0031325B61
MSTLTLLAPCGGRASGVETEDRARLATYPWAERLSFNGPVPCFGCAPGTAPSHAIIRLKASRAAVRVEPVMPECQKQRI